MKAIDLFAGLGGFVDSRIDLVHGAPGAHEIPPMPAAEHIEHMALRIARADTMPTPRAAAPDVRPHGQPAGAGTEASDTLPLFEGAGA